MPFDVPRSFVLPPEDGTAPEGSGAESFGYGQPNDEVGDSGFHPPTAAEMLTLTEAARAARHGQSSSALDERRRRLAAEHGAFRDAKVPEGAPSAMLAAVQRVAAQGETRATIFTFPSEFCNDLGRAINNCEPDWPSTLIGLAQHYHRAFRAVFEPAGYLLGAEIVTWPDLMPGDVALFIQWHRPKAGL